MKISISLLFVFTFCSSLLFAQNDLAVTLEYDEVVDTVITFNPDTNEETMQIIRRPAATGGTNHFNPQGISITRDTIIYFNKETLAEETVIVTRTGERPQELNIPPLQSAASTIQVDTIIYYNPETQTERMQIVRRKKN